jgi:hypothetical protein
LPHRLQRLPSAATLRKAKDRRDLHDAPVEIDDTSDHHGSTQHREPSFAMRVHAALVSGLMLIS